MNGDPIDWLTRHYTEGVHLRERGAAFREDNTVEVSAWEKDVATWINELKEGIHFWSPGHTVRLDPLNRIRVEPVTRESFFYDPEAVGLEYTATAEGRPGNNILSRLGTLVDRAYEILQEWRTEPPEQNRKPGRPAREKPLKERAKDWAAEMRFRPNREKAKEIAKREGINTESVEREVRRVRKEKREKAGKPSNFSRP